MHRDNNSNKSIDPCGLPSALKAMGRNPNQAGYMTTVSDRRPRVDLSIIFLFFAALFLMALPHIVQTVFGNTEGTRISSCGIIGMGSYKCPYFVINYINYGFVKRGLVATLVALFPETAEAAVAQFLLVGVMIALAVVTATALSRARQKMSP